MESSDGLQPVTPMRPERRFVDNFDYLHGGLTLHRLAVESSTRCGTNAVGTWKTELHHPTIPNAKLPQGYFLLPLSCCYILLICVSPLYLSRPSSRCSHHSNSIDSQINLNHGVNVILSSLNILFSSSAVTYRVSLASLGLTSRSTSALINRM